MKFQLNEKTKKILTWTAVIAIGGVTGTIAYKIYKEYQARKKNRAFIDEQLPPSKK